MVCPTCLWTGSVPSPPEPTFGGLNCNLINKLGKENHRETAGAFIEYPLNTRVLGAFLRNLPSSGPCRPLL